jgi:hypothetical protein
MSLCITRDSQSVPVRLVCERRTGAKNRVRMMAAVSFTIP